jgi:hypothetical protein
LSLILLTDLYHPDAGLDRDGFFEFAHPFGGKLANVSVHKKA